MTVYSQVSTFFSAFVRKLQLACSQNAVTTVTEFGKSRATYPLKNPTVVIGIREFSLPVSKGTTVGTNKSGTTAYNATATGDLALDIYIPKTSNGSDCYKIFDILIDAALDFSDVTVNEPYCKAPEYIRNAGAVVLKAGIKFSALFG